MASDMVAAARCLRVVAWLNSDFELLLKLLEAWAEEIERELDFRVRVCIMYMRVEGLTVRLRVCKKRGSTPALVYMYTYLPTRTQYSYNKTRWRRPT